MVITNNFFSILPPDSCQRQNRRILVTNRHYSHMLEAYYANKTHMSHFEALAGVLCTDKTTCLNMFRLLLFFLIVSFICFLTHDYYVGLARR